MYSENLLTLFGRYSVAKAQYEMELFALIEATRKAEEGFGMKAMGFSHPYSYEAFCELQRHTKVVQQRWEALSDIQKEVLNAYCVQIQQIEPPRDVDGDAKGGH